MIRRDDLICRTVGWVIVFSTFLLGCVDYGRIYQSHNLAEIVVPQCVHRSVGSALLVRDNHIQVLIRTRYLATRRFSGLTLLLVIAFGAFYLSRLVEFGLGVRRLWDMHEFYAELLEIPEVRVWPQLTVRRSSSFLTLVYARRTTSKRSPGTPSSLGCPRSGPRTRPRSRSRAASPSPGSTRTTWPRG